MTPVALSTVMMLGIISFISIQVLIVLVMGRNLFSIQMVVMTRITLTGSIPVRWMVHVMEVE
eukprot:CAMPEP_0172489546 /NCGR_PEP_ID=MMETSP1066-20121228/19624_1 /TAXON_ID=671091 /ORGANISM="Coscinodiscus wailesii, Strain CCMP2513" /LENGTH=61 /DNA_ID=CAMNT_0013257493 /DNA_START=132 /DNA_END=314 /DNA_ORIENTATION=-